MNKPQVIHIMADGSIRDSIEGVVIQNEQFYQVLRGIMEKRKKVTRECTGSVRQ